MASRTVAVAVFSAGIVLCSASGNPGTTAKKEQQKLLSGLEIAQWDHTVLERGSSGHVGTSHIWKFVIEREAKRVFMEFGSRSFLFWKSIAVGTGCEPIFGILDSGGNLSGTVSVKSFFEVQKCRNKIVLFQWNRPPRDEFRLALSTTAAYQLVEHGGNLAGASSVICNSAYPMPIGKPFEPSSEDHLFWLESASPGLLSHLVSDQTASLTHIRKIFK
jgi:hypothetical protein